MTTALKHPFSNILDNLDGFYVEIDAAHERADIVLKRPPFNVIQMPQRDQLRATFEALDADDRVRIIVLRAEGEHFSSGGAKKMVNETEDCLLTTAIEVEGHCYSRLRNSEDFKEGVEAFHGKRQPKFVGR